MELSGLQIFKHLPAAKKLLEANCKACGFPTCMAFALKIAQKQTSIDKCPFTPEELKNLLNEAFKIQQHEITFGKGKQLKIGGETVMFRHEKTFINKPVTAITLDSADSDFDKKLDKIKNYSIDRIGEIFKVDAINLIDNGNLQTCIDKITQANLGLIIETENAEIIEKIKDLNPIIKTNKKLSDKDITTAINGKNIEEIAKNSLNAQSLGLKKLVLNIDLNNKTTAQIIEELTQIRRLAIIKKSEPFIYPVMTRVKETDPYKALAIASLLICRYSNLIIFDIFNEALLTTAFTLIQNIYSNPQKPLQVDSKVYEINEPDENSFVFMTTNFALTYFAVLSEIESLTQSSYIVITPSDGMSVLTAWSANKFTPEMVAKIINSDKKLNKVKNKKIIIPGLLSHMKEELDEALPDWQILVGPNEAFKIQDFVKNI